VTERAQEPFARLPHRLAEPLRRHELSCGGFAILALLHIKADEESREYAATLRGLAAEVNWDKTEVTLWRELHRLRDAGLIDFDSKPGQRTPYVFRLASADIATSGDLFTTSSSTSSPEAPAVKRSTSALKRSEQRSIPLPEQGSDATDLNCEEVEAPLDVDVDVEEKTLAADCVGSESGEQRRQRPADPVWDAVADLLGFSPAADTSAHGARNKAVRDLKTHGATPETIRAAGAAYKREWPNATLTDTALAKHYPRYHAQAVEQQASARSAELHRDLDEWVAHDAWKLDRSDVEERIERARVDGLRDGHADELLRSDAINRDDQVAARAAVAALPERDAA
jgi:hypothetical protein